MISLPPVEVGADQETRTEDAPEVPETDLGRLGVVAGVIEESGLAAAPAPFLLMATTVKVYAVPFVRPETVHVSVPPVLQVAPPGLAVTVYPVTAAPPELAGAAQLTTTRPDPNDPRTEVGAPGTVESTTVPEVAAAPVPALLMATTVNV